MASILDSDLTATYGRGHVQRMAAASASGPRQRSALRTIGSDVVGRSVPSHLIFDKGSLRLLPEWKTRAHEGKYGSAGRLPAAPAAQSLLPTGAGRCASSLQAPQSADGYADELDDPELVVAVMRVELQVRKLGLLATVLILFGLST